MNRSGKHARRHSKRRGQVAVGLVGVGAIWDRRYRDAVQRLADRLSVRVVYDAVLARAEMVAAELGAETATGLRQLFERPDLDCVLVLDAAWYDLYPAELACRHRKPAFLAGALGSDIGALESLHDLSQQHETLLMTEFSRRYTPATTRLRELIATRLGPATRLAIEAVVPLHATHGPLPGQDCEQDYLAGLFDWCQYVTGRTPTTIHAKSLLGSAGASAAYEPWQIEVGYRLDPAGLPATIACLNLQPADCVEPPDEEWPFPKHDVTCEHGRAIIAGATEICWQNGSDPGPGTERLLTDRTDAEVMLVQFSRRVLGGLVPVADVHDVCRALSLVQAAEQSRLTGQVTAARWPAY